MSEKSSSRLVDFADLVLAIGREIRQEQERSAETCTAVESSVMRHIDRNPGTSARSTSEAVLLPSSNLSRVLRSLEKKGLVRREADTRDARRVLLYPTALAQQNFGQLREVWTGLLGGIVDEPDAIDMVNALLRRVEAALVARRRKQPRR